MPAAYPIQSIHQHFFQVASWVDPGRTADILSVGQPDRRVHRIGVGWSACAQNLEAAAADGCELFISHESLFYGPQWAAGIDSADTPWGRRRRAALESYGMACLRLHDTWDNFPEVGIREAWRKFLGLGELVAEQPYHRPGGDFYAPGKSLALSRVPPTTLGAFAANLSARCKAYPCFGGALVCGHPAAEVRLVATGVGCHIPTLEMHELGADVLVVTLDRALQESIRVPLAEMNASWIAVEHGISEMPGMQSLAAYLERAFPGVQATFYSREPAVWLAD